MWLQRRWQLLALKVFGNQRVVRHLQTKLHGQIQAGRGLARAAHAQQDDFCALQVMVGLSVVVGQRVVDGLHAVQIFLALADVREPPHAVLALEAQLFFQRLHKGAEHVHQQALALLIDHAHHFLIDQGAEDDGLFAFDVKSVVNLSDSLVRLVYGVDKRNAHNAWLDIKLGHQGRAKGFCGNAGAVRDDKYSARMHGAIIPFKFKHPKLRRNCPAGTRMTPIIPKFHRSAGR